MDLHTLSAGTRVPASVPYLEKLKSLFNSRDPKAVEAVRQANAAFAHLKAITPGTVHVDQALSNLSIAYTNSAYIGEQLMPVVTVPHMSNFFYKFDKRSRMAYPDDELGARGSPNELSQSMSTDNYSCKGYGYKQYVDNLTLRNQDAPVNELADVIASLNEGIAFRREKRIAAVLTTAGNYGGNTIAIGGSDAWNSVGKGDPIGVIMAAKSAVWRGGGSTKLVGFTTHNVMNVLMRHTAMLDLFKYGGTTPGLATSNMIAGFLGLDEILVAESRQDTANENQTAAYSRIWPDVFGVISVATAPSLRSASFGYTFRFGTVNTDQWYDPSLGPMGGYYGRVSVLEDHKVVAPDTSYLITAPIV